MNTKIHHSINGLSENDINAELNRLASLEMKAFTPIRTPVCITLDLSGSMRHYLAVLKEIIRIMDNELRVVQKREFTIFIMGIYNSVPTVLYFGDLRSFDFTSFVDSLPKSCYGSTPLAASFTKADEVLERFKKICEVNNHWYTIPVFFSVTDSQSTDSSDDCSKVINKFKFDIADNEKLLVEFVTGSNPNGLNLGGYKIPIDESGSKDKIIAFMHALRIATSTEANLEESGTSRMPVKRDRKAYNRYMSDIMLINFKFCYDRNH